MTDPSGFSDAEVDALRSLAKEALRQRAAGLRRALTADARRARSAAMCKALAELDAFRTARLICAYAPLKFEIDPTDALHAALSEGKTVALPRAVPGTRELSLHRYRAGDALLESGLGVREPASGADAVDPGRVDLVLVPGLAFDLRGQRLGYGKGYYDRLLPRLGGALRVGLCFELSVWPELPASAFDVPVDLIVTERRVVACGRGAPPPEP